MLANLIARRVVPAARQFSTSAARLDHHDTSGIAGSTLPFGLKNKYLLFVGFTIFFSSGLGLPFLIVRRNILLQQ